VIGLPPLSAGAVHFTVSEVALMSAAVEVMLGEVGASELTGSIHMLLRYNANCFSCSQPTCNCWEKLP